MFKALDQFREHNASDRVHAERGTERRIGRRRPHMLTGQAIPSLEMLERRERERKVMESLPRGSALNDDHRGMDDLDLDQPIASPPLVTIHDADLASV